MNQKILVQNRFFESTPCFPAPGLGVGIKQWICSCGSVWLSSVVLLYDEGKWWVTLLAGDPLFSDMLLSYPDLESDSDFLKSYEIIKRVIHPMMMTVIPQSLCRCETSALPPVPSAGGAVGLEQEVGSGRLWPQESWRLSLCNYITFSIRVIYLKNTCIQELIEAHRKCEVVIVHVLNQRRDDQSFPHQEHERWFPSSPHSSRFIVWFNACLLKAVHIVSHTSIE